MRLIATVGGIGHLRPAPGTWGSAVALVLAWAILSLGGLWLFLAALVAIIPLGLAAAKAEMEASGDSDPDHVVVDELAGQWIALLPVAVGVHMMGRAPLDLWPGWVAAFVLFRLFDIWKPGPIGRIDRRRDVTGVMGDDLVAGVFAALGTAALAALAHGMMRAFA